MKELIEYIAKSKGPIKPGEEIETGIPGKTILPLFDKEEKPLKDEKGEQKKLIIIRRPSSDDPRGNENPLQPTR